MKGWGGEGDYILDMLCLRCLCEHVQKAAGHTELDMGRRVIDIGFMAAKLTSK